MPNSDLSEVVNNNNLSDLIEQLKNSADIPYLIDHYCAIFFLIGKIGDAQLLTSLLDKLLFLETLTKSDKIKILYSAFNSALYNDQVQIIKTLASLPEVRNNPVHLKYNANLAKAKSIAALNILLEIPGIEKNVSLNNFDVLHSAVKYGDLYSTKRLLRFSEVKNHLATSMFNPHLEVLAMSGKVTLIDTLIQHFSTDKHARITFKALKQIVDDPKNYKIVHAIFTRLNQHMNTIEDHSKFVFKSMLAALHYKIAPHLQKAEIEVNKYKQLYTDMQRRIKGKNLPNELWAKIIDYVHPGLDIIEIKLTIDANCLSKSLYSAIIAINDADMVLAAEAKRVVNEESEQHVAQSHASRILLN